MVYGERFHRLCVDGRPKRIKKFAFTSVCVYNRLCVDGVIDQLDEGCAELSKTIQMRGSAMQKGDGKPCTLASRRTINFR